MPRNRDRRFPINLPLIKEIRLSLWAHTRGVSKTRMAEAIVIDRVSNVGNWNEVCRDLQQEAAIRQIPVEDLIKEVLQSDGFDDALEIDQVDWSCLIEGVEPQLETDEED